MNKEETLSNLKAYLNGDTAIGNIIPLRSVIESALEYLEPSLPSNLDEAAEEYAKRQGIELAPFARKFFKAGAVWMAGQGYVDEVKYSDLEDRKYVFVPYEEFNPGDKVVVQFRKK